LATSKLFVSHDVSDKPLVDALVSLLEGGIGVRPSDIFCASLKGQGVKAGADFKESIREHLDDASCVIALITPRFYSSAYCMCELGGVWIQAKSLVPILVPPLTFSDLKAVLVGVQALKVMEKADLDQLRDDVVERLSITPLPTPRWNDRRDTFLSSLPAILKQLPPEATVSRATHGKTLKVLSEYKAEYEKSEKEVHRLLVVNAELMKLKDRAKVAAVVRKHSTAIENFESLVDAAKKALYPLPKPVCEALYYRARGEDYLPKGQEDWEDVQRPIEDGQLSLNANENGVCPRRSDPKVGKAMIALDDLRNWLEHAPSDFFEWYAATHEDARADLDLRPFWEEHLH
jgi:hypothetical protein